MDVGVMQSKASGMCLVAANLGHVSVDENMHTRSHESVDVNMAYSLGEQFKVGAGLRMAISTVDANAGKIATQLEFRVQIAPEVEFLNLFQCS